MWKSPISSLEVKGNREPQRIEEVEERITRLENGESNHYPQSEPLVLIVRIYYPSPSYHLFTIVPNSYPLG